MTDTQNAVEVILSAKDCELLLARVEHAVASRGMARRLVVLRSGEFDAAQKATHDFARASELLAWAFEDMGGLEVLRALVARAALGGDQP
jgi:hypothetical protein